MNDNLIKKIDLEIDEILKNFDSKSLFENFPVEIDQKETKNQLLKESKQIRDNFLKGYQLVLNAAGNGHFSETKERFVIKPFEKKISKEECLENLKNNLLQEICHYTPQMMRQIYDLSFEMYHKKEFDKCVDLTTFLAILNPTVSFFWQLLGRSYEAKKDFYHARFAFTCAINCDLRSVRPYQDMVRCCLENKEYKEALAFLDFGLKVAKIEQKAARLAEFKHGLEAMKDYVHKLAA